MSLRACPKCQYRFYQIMDYPARDPRVKEHYVICSSCGTLLGTFREFTISREEMGP